MKSLCKIIYGLLQAIEEASLKPGQEDIKDIVELGRSSESELVKDKIDQLGRCNPRQFRASLEDLRQSLLSLYRQKISSPVDMPPILEQPLLRQSRLASEGWRTRLVEVSSQLPAARRVHNPNLTLFLTNSDARSKTGWIYLERRTNTLSCLSNSVSGKVVERIATTFYDWKNCSFVQEDHHVVLRWNWEDSNMTYHIWFEDSKGKPMPLPAGFLGKFKQILCLDGLYSLNDPTKFLETLKAASSMQMLICLNAKE